MRDVNIAGSSGHHQKRQQPENVWSDQMLQVGRPLNARHRRFATLLARNATNAEIVKELGYSPSRISVLKTNTQIRSVAERIRDLVFERTVSDRIKDLGNHAMDIIEHALTSNEMKLRDRVELAKWVIEKIDGKSGQKVEVRNSSLEKFLSVLNEMRLRNEALEDHAIKIHKAREPAAASVPSALTEPPSAAEDRQSKLVEENL